MLGKLVTVEGIDSSGKTTLCKSLVEYLNSRGVSAIYTSAISDECTEFGKLIGKLMKDNSFDLHYDAECALMVAARIDSARRVVYPALLSGQWVVSDRWKSSLYAYQKGPDGKLIDPKLADQRLNAFGLGRDADLEILLDIDPEKTHKEMDAENRLEVRSRIEWNRMRDVFKSIHYSNPTSVKIDASLPKDLVFKVARKYVNLLIDGYPIYS